MIKLENLTIRSSGKNIINGLNASFNGKTIVIGHNGAGKTTLIKAMLGIINHTGRIDIPKNSQRFTTNLIDVYKILNVSALDLIKIYARAMESDSERIISILERFKIKYILKRRITRLSTGEARLFSLAMAIGLNGWFTMLDEPFENLDISRREEAIKMINDLNRDLLIVTHDIQVLNKLNFSDMYLMVNGSMAGPLPRADLKNLYLSREDNGRTILSFSVMGRNFYINKDAGDYPIMSFHSMDELIQVIEG
ncbi:ATP-binding cassette domain-containing protein [Picrophilus oshimae]|uniref:ABC transporter ATP-binding protein n=1 Tax=Picrophilus torridus (strain ATCC 700027 / DSM 9790 / JCM 10055 / NBRC 100828 / KAW 2/3) TaxID=1122961 RepID=Q6L0K0_PICTO|nr:ATP-binding cassette domain-containing protein [Picrophilus oshimae]AAT43502.1 ABC transporter ATP-binding protein [Picrophilus oshimae DSM 9789]